MMAPPLLSTRSATAVSSSFVQFVHGTLIVPSTVSWSRHVGPRMYSTMAVIVVWSWTRVWGGHWDGYA